MNVRLFGAVPCWNGIIRLVFLIATVWMSLGSDAAFFALLAVATHLSRLAPSSDCHGARSDPPGAAD
jgi:hypothetical protein